jgi:hypothetical protein
VCVFGWWIDLFGCDIERIQTYIANMAAMANEVLEFAGPEGDEQAQGKPQGCRCLFMAP